MARLRRNGTGDISVRDVPEDLMPSAGESAEAELGLALGVDDEGNNVVFSRDNREARRRRIERKSALIAWCRDVDLDPPSPQELERERSRRARAIKKEQKHAD